MSARALRSDANIILRFVRDEQTDDGLHEDLLSLDPSGREGRPA